MAEPTKRYYDLGMVDTAASDMPDGIPTREQIVDLFDQVKDMTKTRPLEIIYNKIAARAPFEGGWESLNFNEQNCLLAIWASYRAQIRDNVKVLADQAS